MPMRLATWMICHASSLASPGGSTILFHCCVRRSVLPNTPSRSTQAAEGRIRSAIAVVGVG